MKISLLLVMSIFGHLAMFAQQSSPTPVLYTAKTIAELKMLHGLANLEQRLPR